MAKTIITIGREYCTGGNYIAEDVANALGIKLYDKEDVYKRQVRAVSLTRATKIESTTLYSACTSMEIIIGMLSFSKRGMISMVPMMFSRTSARCV